MVAYDKGCVVSTPSRLTFESVCKSGVCDAFLRALLLSSPQYRKGGEEVPAGTMNGDIVGVRDKRAPFSPVCSSEDRPWTAICKAAIRCLR